MCVCYVRWWCSYTFRNLSMTAQKTRWKITVNQREKEGDLHVVQIYKNTNFIS